MCINVCIINININIINIINIIINDNVMCMKMIIANDM